MGVCVPPARAVADVRGALRPVAGADVQAGHERERGACEGHWDQSGCHSGGVSWRL